LYGAFCNEWAKALNIGMMYKKNREMNKAIKVKYHKNGKKFLYLVWLTVGVSKVQCND